MKCPLLLGTVFDAKSSAEIKSPLSSFVCGRASMSGHSLNFLLHRKTGLCSCYLRRWFGSCPFSNDPIVFDNLPQIIPFPPLPDPSLHFPKKQKVDQVAESLRQKTNTSMPCCFFLSARYSFPRWNEMKRPGRLVVFQSQASNRTSVV